MDNKFKINDFNKNNDSSILRNNFSNYRSTSVKRSSLDGLQLVEIGGLLNNMSSSIKKFNDVDSDESSNCELLIEKVDELDIDENDCMNCMKNIVNNFIEDEKEQEKIVYTMDDLYNMVEYKNRYYQLMLKSNNTFKWNRIVISSKFDKRKILKRYYFKLPSVELYSENDIIIFRNEAYQLTDDIEENNKWIYYWNRIPKKCKLGKYNRISINTIRINNSSQLNIVNCNNMDIIYSETEDEYYQMIDVKEKRWRLLSKKFNPNDVGPHFIPRTCKKMVMKGMDNRLYVSNKNRFGKYEWRKERNITDTVTAIKYYSQYKNYKNKYNYNKTLRKIKLLDKKLTKNKIYFYLVPWKDSYDMSDLAWKSTKKFIKEQKKKDPNDTSYIFLTRHMLFFGTHETGKLYLQHHILKRDIKKIDGIFEKIFKKKFNWDKNNNHSIEINLK